MYTGIAPGYSQEIGNCLVFIAIAFGNSLQFVMSEYVSGKVNLYILLTMSAVAVPMFAIADLHFGSGGSSRRACCKKPYEKAVDKGVTGENTDSTG